MGHDQNLTAEVKSWLIEDPVKRAEKFQRERIRHYGLIRSLLLDKLDTSVMHILDVGGGPMPVSDLLAFRSRTVVDPLSEAYATVISCPDHVVKRIEDIDIKSDFDLVIATNSLDHVDMPRIAVNRMSNCLRPGGYLAVLCAENNAITNPHPAHVHNLTAHTLHRWLDRDFETVWELNYREHGFRYGWVPFEGRRGQPAFALLMRKCSGY